MEAGLKAISNRLARIEGTRREGSSPEEEYPISLEDPELKHELGEDTQPPQFERQLNGSRSPPPPHSVKSEHAIPATPSRYDAAEIGGGEQELAPGPIALDDEEEEPGPEVSPGKPTIPVNHTTGAARLLLEPSIECLIRDFDHEKLRKWKEKYPVLQEASRGVLRLYGRGEGVDRPPGYERQVDYGAEGTPSDAHSDISSPAGEDWGQVGGLTPGAEDNSPPVQRGIIDIEGMPDFSRETVERYVKSYNDHLNIMHPILVPRHLDALVGIFLKSIPGSSIKPRQVETRFPMASFVGSSQHLESPGQKRKRSPGTTADSPEVPHNTDLKPGHPFRSIGTALVLLVMALGAICEHKTGIPDIAKDQNDDHSAAGSPQMRNSHPRSPIQASPTLSSATGLPSPQDGMFSRSRRTSSEGAHYHVKSRPSRHRNLDLIPSLSYFALATDILGNQNGGNSLQHVHANILAGLYHGQLGRVLESHSFIHNACRALQHILRP